MIKKHAIVIGASIGGLGTARILSKYFERVTVVDRDSLPIITENRSRESIPQGNHAHGLLASGYRILDSYFPSLMEELVAEGALKGDIAEDMSAFYNGSWGLRMKSGIYFLSCSRPCLESKVRKLVQFIPNVTIIEKRNVLQPIFESSTQTVKGVKLLDIESEEALSLEADLVVDASGRASLSPKWLESWGFDKPEETSLKIDVTYSTFRFERKPNDLRAPMGLVIAGSAPVSKRTGFAFAIEGNQWLVSLNSKLGDNPPLNTIQDFREFARSLPAQDIYELIKEREPLSEFCEFKLQGYRRVHYEKLKRFPKNYLVIGDALCNFNPTFGQGMSTALKEIQALDDCLANGDEKLSECFFPKASKIIDAPWLFVTADDFAFPETIGKRPKGLRHKLLAKYMRRFFMASRKDPIVRIRALEIQTLLEPPSAIFSPNIMWRVLKAYLA